MNLSLFLQILIVFCCFKQCWNRPVRGLGGAKCSDTLIEELFEFAKTYFFAIPHLNGAVTAKHPLHYRVFGSLVPGLRGVASICV